MSVHDRGTGERNLKKKKLLINVTTCYKCQFPAFTVKIIYTVIVVIIFDDFFFIDLTMLEIYSYRVQCLLNLLLTSVK